MNHTHRCMLSFDVEEWFQVENLKGVIKGEQWHRLDSRIVANIDKLLSLLDDYKCKATFFILGWVARRYPELVSRIYQEGHEIASHGYTHKLVYNMSKSEFKEDVQETKKLLERITGDEVIGYRAPSFTITDWAIDILKEAGYQYDSSYFPAAYHDRYGKLKLGDQEVGGGIIEVRDGFYELLIPTLRILGRRIPWGGGGYFRLFPYSIYKAGVKKILKDNGRFLFYLHPWELDPDQPRMKVPWLLSYRHYHNLEKTQKRLMQLLKDFEFIPLKETLNL